MEEAGRLRGQAPVQLLTCACPGSRCSIPLAGGKPPAKLRAQVATEFTVAVSAVLLLFFLFYMLYANQIVIAGQANDNMVSMRVASAVRSAINYVYLAGDGTQYNATFRTSGINVTIEAGEVVARSAFGASYMPLLTDRVNATSIGTGNVIIRNHGGVIGIG